MPNRNAWAAVPLLLLAAGCTVPDDTVVVAIGTMFNTFGDHDLQTQVVTVTTPTAPYTIQVMQWDIDEMVLSGLSPDPIDLMFGDPTCGFLDTAFALPRRNGKCGDGVILNANVETLQATLHVQTRITVRWLDPPQSFPPGVDFDGDGLNNEVDNCMLISNPDQLDTGDKGFGDACATYDPFLRLTLLDSDKDGVVDLVDNCPYTTNPDQADDGIEYPPGSGIFVPDAIGNACDQNEQIVQVQAGLTIDLSLGPTGVLQPFRGNSFLNADFAGSVNCAWNAATCTINTSAVSLCFDVSGSFSCP